MPEPTNIMRFKAALGVTLAKLYTIFPTKTQIDYDELRGPAMELVGGGIADMVAVFYDFHSLMDFLVREGFLSGQTDDNQTRIYGAQLTLKGLASLSRRADDDSDTLGQRITAAVADGNIAALQHCVSEFLGLVR